MSAAKTGKTDRQTPDRCITLTASDAFSVIIPTGLTRDVVPRASMQEFDILSLTCMGTNLDINGRNLYNDSMQMSGRFLGIPRQTLCCLAFSTCFGGCHLSYRWKLNAGVIKYYVKSIDRQKQRRLTIRCLLCVYVITETSAASCRKSLGMHSGAIADEAITASSSYDSVSVGPAFGRFAYTYTPVSSLSLLTFSTTNMFILL